MSGSKSWRRIFGGIVVLLAFGAGPCEALCRSPNQAALAAFLGPAVVDTYQKSPRLLLQVYRHNDSDLVLAVQQVALRGKDAATGIIAVLPFADDGQHAAIAKGLKEAADICLAHDMTVARGIQMAAQASNDPIIKRAFNNNTPAQKPVAAAPASQSAGDPSFGVSNDSGGLLDPEKSTYELPDPFAPIQQ